MGQWTFQRLGARSQQPLAAGLRMRRRLRYTAWRAAGFVFQALASDVTASTPPQFFAQHFVVLDAVELFVERRS
jgi:hypothetical protein